MILGLAWDQMTPGVQSQIVRDLLAVNEDLTSVYWTGVELDTVMRILGVRRCQDREKVEVWRTYQVGETSVVPPTPVDSIPCVLHQDREKENLQVSPARPRKEPDEQGWSNTFNPYDVPMPDPYGKSLNPILHWVWN